MIKIFLIAILFIFPTTQALAGDIVSSAKDVTLNAMKEEYAKLKGYIAEDLGAYNQNTYPQVLLRVFVSTSMSDALLSSYAKEAKKYNAVLVLSGLPNESWQELSKLVTRVTEGEEIAIQIDDEAFREFRITNVPTFILSKEDWTDFDAQAKVFDKISGNIGIKSALEEFAKEGDLSEEAEQLLLSSNEISK